ncbi:MoaD/ThiS family protein [Myxococcota bacterium]
MRVELYATLRAAAKESGFEMDPPGDVRALFDELGSKYGSGFLEGLKSAGGELSPGVIVLVNGVNVHALDGLETRLKPQDTVAIFPPIGGG